MTRRDAAEVLASAAAALRARPWRTGLMAVGPLLGVAVIVASIGLLESAHGEVRAALERLGSNLVIVETAATSDDAAPDQRLPDGAATRIVAIPTVEQVTGIATVTDVVVRAAPPPTGLQPLAGHVLTADAELLDVLNARITWGRALTAADHDASLPAAVVGSSLARRLLPDRGGLQTIWLNDQAFAVVGTTEPSPLFPQLNSAVLIPTTTARTRFGTDPGASHLLVRVDHDHIHETAQLLPAALTLGAPGPPAVRIPADLIAARAEVDRTLTAAVLALGFLAMLVGAFGIANVMVISVLERRREIGIRRALGHPRITIAAQFLAETFLVGVLGASAGLTAGVAAVHTVANLRGHTPVHNPTLATAAVTLALAVTAIAGLYPALRAANMHPLDALRHE